MIDFSKLLKKEDKKDAAAFREMVFNASRKNALLGPIEHTVVCKCGYVLNIKQFKEGKKVCPNCIKVLSIEHDPLNDLPY